MNHYEAAETAGRKKLMEELPYLDFEFSSTLDRTDFKATNRITGERITGELKAYINAEHKRYSTGKEGRQYEDYWIDYDKCIAVKEPRRRMEARLWSWLYLWISYLSGTSTSTDGRIDGRGKRLLPRADKTIGKD